MSNATTPVKQFKKGQKAFYVCWGHEDKNTGFTPMHIRAITFISCGKKLGKYTIDASGDLSTNNAYAPFDNYFATAEEAEDHAMMWGFDRSARYIANELPSSRKWLAEYGGGQHNNAEAVAECKAQIASLEAAVPATAFEYAKW